jgi:hypothetical protein
MSNLANDKIKKQVQQRHRKLLVFKIYNEIITNLTREQGTNKNLIIQKLAYKNQSLMNSPTATFIYNGKLYPVGTTLRPVTLQIHPDIKKQLIELFPKESHEMTLMQIERSKLLKKILSVSKHFDDIMYLLPTKWKKHFIPSGFNEDVFNIAEPKKLEELDQIIKENEHLYTHIKKQKLIDIILQD